MQTRTLTQNPAPFRPTLVLANAALLLLLSSGAYAQASLSPPPTIPGIAGPAPSFGKSDTAPKGGRGTRRGKVDFNDLFSGKSQKVTAAETPAVAHDPIAALCSWPSGDAALYWADPQNGSLSGAIDLPPGFPDSTILLPGPDDIGRSWPTDSPTEAEEPPRDETTPSFRITEDAQSSGPVDLEPALEAVYRTFLEEQPTLLAFHLRREEFMGLNTPGHSPGSVRSDLLLDRLNALFATRHTISLEYLRPYPMDNARFGVKAWYTYRDADGNIYQAHLRFVLKPIDDRLILTSFALD